MGDISGETHGQIQSQIHNLEERLEEAEIKCAFLEKESEEHREAAQILHTRLSLLEEKVRQLQREIPDPNIPKTTGS